MTEQRPVLDSEVAAAVRAGVNADGSPMSAGFPSVTPETIVELRERFRGLAPSDEELSLGGRVEVREVSVPGLSGNPDVSALILSPAGLTELRPGMLVTNCGGKIFAGNRSIGIAEWVAEFGVVAVSLAVRAAPEDPHPAQVEDGYAGLCWVSEHAESLNIDRTRLAILGISGGGGVAAATALYARDHGGPPISHQILIIPMLDDRELHPSSKFEGVMWDRTSNRTGWSAMLGAACGGPDVSEYAAPARAQDLRGLPPAYLDVYSAEVFRDEVVDYGARLARAGVPVELHLWVGGLHGSEGLVPDSELTKAAKSARHSFLRRIFGPSGTGLEAW